MIIKLSVKISEEIVPIVSLNYKIASCFLKRTRDPEHLESVTIGSKFRVFQHAYP